MPHVPDRNGLCHELSIARRSLFSVRSSGRPSLPGGAALSWRRRLGVRLRTPQLLAFCLSALLPLSALAQTQVSERIELSGFARLIGGVLDDGDAEYAGYEDRFSVSNQSLFAVQADVDLVDGLSLAAQGLLHSSASRNSSFEWLYLRYQPTAHWQLRVGRLRTPFQLYSNVIDVGYAYPWISAPAPVYGSYLFSNYEGASTTFRTTLACIQFDLEAYYGSDDLVAENRYESVPVEVDELRGLVLTAERGNLVAKAGYHKAGKVTAALPELALLGDLLREAGFPRSADSLALEAEVEFYQAGLRYDNLSWFVIGEYLRVETDLVIGPPMIEGSYLTLGKNFAPFQAHLTIGRASSDDSEGLDEIPRGVSPDLDALGAGYDLVFDSLYTDNLDYYSAGLRWDVAGGLALKAEVSLLEERAPSRFFLPPREAEEEFDGRAMLFQLGLEWVF